MADGKNKESCATAGCAVCATRAAARANKAGLSRVKREAVPGAALRSPGLVDAPEAKGGRPPTLTSLLHSLDGLIAEATWARDVVLEGGVPDSVDLGHMSVEVLLRCSDARVARTEERMASAEAEPPSCSNSWERGVRWGDGEVDEDCEVGLRGEYIFFVEHMSGDDSPGPWTASVRRPELNSSQTIRGETGSFFPTHELARQACEQWDQRDGADSSHPTATTSESPKVEED